MSEEQFKLLDAELGHNVTFTEATKTAVVATLVKEMRGGQNKKVMTAVNAYVTRMAPGTGMPKACKAKAETIFDLAADA